MLWQERKQTLPSLWGVNFPSVLLQVAFVFWVHPRHKSKETPDIIRGLITWLTWAASFRDDVREGPIPPVTSPREGVLWPGFPARFSPWYRPGTVLWSVLLQRDGPITAAHAPLCTAELCVYGREWSQEPHCPECLANPELDCKWARSFFYFLKQLFET